MLKADSLKLPIKEKLLCFSDSINQANSEVIPPKKDAQPEGSTAETTNDTK